MTGVRGPLAIVAIAMALSACSNELIVLLPGEDGRIGALDVRGRSGKLTLDAPYAAARPGFLGDVDPVAVEQQQLRRDFAGALAAVPPAPVSYTLYFEEGTSTLVAASRAGFAKMLADVRARPVSDIAVTGHTDRVGSVEDNDRLARQRAGMVRAVLMREGLAADAVRAVGRGEREPLVATADEVREPRNRRVEIIVR